MTKREDGFGGQRVVSFESRRAAEMASLIERHGGEPMQAPTMREVALSDASHAKAFCAELMRGGYDLVVLMTGVGTRALFHEGTSARQAELGPHTPGEELAPEISREELAAVLGRVTVVARGPKPAAALKELGVSGFITVPEPNTWREVLATLEAKVRLDGLRVAVQEHGAPSRELYAALEERGARVTPVPVYRWALPEDTGPLRSALHAIARGEAIVALFTSRAQVEHAFAIAAEEGIAERVRERLAAGIVASIGPVCSEALRAEGVPPHIEPDHPKMGHLVKAAAARAEAEATKGRGAPSA
jgi:uroporphyrinogen-III synthase